MLDLFAQTTSQTAEGPAAVVWILYMVVIVAVLASMWRLFVKAGEPGWAAIVPIYNYYVLLKIVGRPAWWLILLFIPFVSLIPAFLVPIDLAKSFGKGIGFALLILFVPVIGYPLLAFGDADYLGPAASSGGTPTPPVNSPPANPNPPTIPPAGPTI